MEALARVEAEVRELIRRSHIDPDVDRSAVSRLVDDALADYEDRSLRSQLPALGDVAAARRRVLDAVAGLGALQPFLDDPTVEEIWINEPGKVFVARAGVAELTTTILTERQVADLVERMLKWSGRRIDLSSPFVDAMLPDGSRLHVVIPDVTREHWAVNIRKFVVRARHLDDLVRLQTLTSQAAQFLAASVAAGLNVLVSGGTQAGNPSKPQYARSNDVATTTRLDGAQDSRWSGGRSGGANRVGSSRRQAWAQCSNKGSGPRPGGSSATPQRAESPGGPGAVQFPR